MATGTLLDRSCQILVEVSEHGSRNVPTEIQGAASIRCLQVETTIDNAEICTPQSLM